MEEKYLAGLKVNNITRQEFLNEIDRLISLQKHAYVVTPYSEFFVRAQRDPEFKKIINAADISTADGIGVAIGLKYMSMPGKWIPLIKCLLAAIFNRHYFKDTLKAKLSGSEFIYDVAELAAQNNYKVFLLGGFDFGHGNTGDLTAQKLKQMYPNLHIAGIHTAGSSDASEDAKTIEIINQADPQILFIAYGPGSQEKWINRNKDKLNPMVSFCLGGTFDYVSGAKRKAPSWAASRGLEGVLRPFFAERSMSAKLSRLKRAWGGIFNFLRLLLSQKH